MAVQQAAVFHVGVLYICAGTHSLLSKVWVRTA
jgi:hypothetical protein